MIDILSTTKPVVNNSSLVKINHENVINFSGSVSKSKSELKQSPVSLAKYEWDMENFFKIIYPKLWISKC